MDALICHWLLPSRALPYPFRPGSSGMEDGSARLRAKVWPDRTNIEPHPLLSTGGSAKAAGG